jgi:ubiquitin-protein ligase
MNILNRYHNKYRDYFIVNKIFYKVSDETIKYKTDKHIYRYKYDIVNDNLKLSPIDRTPNDMHLIRMINLQQKSNNILNLEKFVKFIVLYLSELNNYCTICNTKLKYPSENINICSNTKCKYKSETLRIDNYVTDIYKKEPINFCFLIRSALCALCSDKKDIVFEPFPDKYRTKKDSTRDIDLSGYNGNDKDFDKLIKIIPSEWFNNIDSLIEFMDCTPSDDYIVKELGLELYEFVRFILKTNNTELFINKILDKKLEQIQDKNIKISNKIDNLIEFKIKHDSKLEDDFNKHDDTLYLFHGSGCGNWYSILRNGLKNCSGSKMQLNGAAFGSGIYFHINALYSIGYSTRSYNNSFGVLGVCLIKNPSKYSKGNGIYVVPDEENVLLKYIYVLPNTNSMIYSNYLNDYYKNIKKEQQIILLNLMPIIIKRLNGEKNKCKKSKRYTLEKELVLNNDYICEWIVSINKRYKNKDNNYQIKISINFLKEFPIKPPIMYIKSHNLIGDNILESGGFAIPELTTKNWKPAKSKIYKILNKVHKIIVDESCYIDGDSNNYNIDDIKNGYYEYEKLL